MGVTFSLITGKFVGAADEKILNVKQITIYLHFIIYAKMIATRLPSDSTMANVSKNCLHKINSELTIISTI